MVNTPREKSYVVRTEQVNLCAPGTFAPVQVTYGYSENDELMTIDARNPDGSPYTGDLSLLVSCAASIFSGGGSIVIGTVDQGAAGIFAWKVDGSGVVQPVSGTVNVGNLPGVQPVSGTVAVSNFPASQDVVVTNFPAEQVVAEASLTLRYDEGATYTYIGNATPGVLTSAAAWRIKRLTNADNTILYADGNANFDNIYDNRAALVYS